MLSVEIVIPSWNGQAILAQCLPSVLECAREVNPPARVTVVDDASTDDTVEWLWRNHPEVNVVALHLRRGFPGAVNEGVRAAQAEVVLLLNNDMIPHGTVLGPLIGHLADPAVAAVSARVLKWDAKTIDVGRRIRHLDRGEIAGVGHNEDFPEVSYTFFASGGAMAFRRSLFLETGGFDEIYSPGYVEDTDFSYRMWKRGLQIIWEPRSTFLHMGSATFAPRKGGLARLFGLFRVRYLSNRNAFYFYWKNLTEESVRREYWRNLPRRIRQDKSPRADGHTDHIGGHAGHRECSPSGHYRDRRIPQCPGRGGLGRANLRGSERHQPTDQRQSKPHHPPNR